MAAKIKKDFKFWLNIFTFVALAFLVVISWEQIKEAFGNLASLNTWALLSMIPIQLVSYYAVARLYKDFFDKQGEHKMSLKTMYKIALELNFVNHVFPSGGVSGFSYLSIRLKQYGVSTAKSTLAQVLRFGLTFLSFLVLLVFGMLFLALGKSTSPLIMFIATSIVVSTIFGAAVGVFIISKASRIKAFVSWLPKGVNGLLRFLRITKRSIIDIDKVEDTLEDLHQDYKLLTKYPKQIRRLFMWALLINVTEVMTVYVVYVAFGELVNPGAVIIAYAVANFAGQNIEEYAKRDQGRPMRDAKVGMLPPKLAQIIINLSGPGTGKTVLDPFCGTGVLLQEALLMGLNVYGTDLEPRMIEYSIKNLEWLKGRHSSLGPLSTSLEVGDATSHEWNLSTLDPSPYTLSVQLSRKIRKIRKAP